MRYQHSSLFFMPTPMAGYPDDSEPQVTRGERFVPETTPTPPRDLSVRQNRNPSDDDAEDSSGETK